MRWYSAQSRVTKPKLNHEKLHSVLLCWFMKDNENISHDLVAVFETPHQKHWSHWLRRTRKRPLTQKTKNGLLIKWSLNEIVIFYAIIDLHILSMYVFLFYNYHYFKHIRGEGYFIQYKHLLIILLTNWMINNSYCIKKTCSFYSSQ